MWIVYIRIQESGRIEGDHEYVNRAGLARGSGKVVDCRCESNSFKGWLHPKSEASGREVS